MALVVLWPLQARAFNRYQLQDKVRRVHHPNLLVLREMLIPRIWETALMQSCGADAMGSRPATEKNLPARSDSE